MWIWCSSSFWLPWPWMLSQAQVGDHCQVLVVWAFIQSAANVLLLCHWEFWPWPQDWKWWVVVDSRQSGYWFYCKSKWLLMGSPYFFWISRFHEGTWRIARTCMCSFQERPHDRVSRLDWKSRLCLWCMGCRWCQACFKPNLAIQKDGASGRTGAMCWQNLTAQESLTLPRQNVAIKV